jgi:adenylate cyclase
MLSATELDTIERRLTTRMVAVGFAYIVIAVGLFVALVEAPPGRSTVDVMRSVAAPITLLSAVVIPSAVYWAQVAYRRTTAWIRDGRSPSDRELAATARGALTLGTQVFVAGLVISTGFAVSVHLLNPWVNGWRTWSAATVTVGGAALLSFLIGERTLGPVLATAAATHRVSPVGIVGRLTTVWAQAAAVPVAALVLSPERVGLDGVRWLVLGSGLVISLAGIIVTGRNVADPLRRMRTAVQRVRAGDLDVHVRPDDGGELGQLQHAFNEMVGAMRDRDRLQVLFGRHVGDAVVLRAMAGDGSLGGEVRQVTALFVDIEGSTELAESLSPDELVVMLNWFFGAVVEVVTAEGGLVNKFEGDAALAIFGAPEDQPDHADRALRAARILRERLAALSLVFPQLDAGIGVATGAAVAGNVGAADRYEYTVIGDPVNVASRLSDMAQEHPGRVLVSETTVAASKQDYANWLADGVAQVRGRRADITLYVPPSAAPHDREAAPAGESSASA